MSNKSDVTSRLEAYAILTHYALDTLWYQVDICCPHCCSPCNALVYLDQEGILDAVVKNWERYSDGTEIPYDSNDWCSWWRDGKVDREWLHSKWEKCHV